MDFVHSVLHDYTRVVSAITDPVSIKTYLEGVGLSSTPPDIKPARPPPQMEFENYEYEYLDEYENQQTF